MNTPKNIEMNMQVCANPNCAKPFIITTPEKISGAWTIQCKHCGIINQLEEIGKFENGNLKFIVMGVFDNGNIASTK